jgi:hypothetical protein
MDNIEKLIQMATIEQMYNMLNKMKENVTQPVNNNESEGLGLELNKELIQLKNTMYGLTAELATCTDIIKQQSFNIHLLIEKVTKLELTLLKDRPKCIVDLELEAPFTYKSKTLGVRYERLEEPSISHTINDKKEIVVKVEEQHIKLNVEEQEQEEELELEEELVSVEEQKEELEQEQEQEQDEEQEDEQEEEQDEEKQEEEQDEEELVSDEKQEEEQDEEELVSDEEELVSVEQDKKDEEAVEELEEEEEDEEVFEIEIDDVSYFATDEENGVLYEITPDKDIGKKVGIIKNGEPIFN